jgi:hypothetical protein
MIDRIGLYLPDIYRTLDQKNGTRGGESRSRISPVGAPWLALAGQTDISLKAPKKGL